VASLESGPIQHVFSMQNFVAFTSDLGLQGAIMIWLIVDMTAVVNHDTDILTLDGISMNTDVTVKNVFFLTPETTITITGDTRSAPEREFITFICGLEHGDSAKSGITGIFMNWEHDFILLKFYIPTPSKRRMELSTAWCVSRNNGQSHQYSIAHHHSIL
jgi:hypothetical protein